MPSAEAHRIQPTALPRRVVCIEPPAFRRVRLFGGLRSLAKHVDLLYVLSVHRVKVRYKQSRLGIAWALLQPLAMMLVFTTMFSFLGGAPAERVPYAVFAYSALVLWSAFASGLSAAAGALTSHAALVTKVYFPREILPLSYVFTAFTDFLIASTALAVLMWWYAIPVHHLALWGLVSVVLLMLFLTGAGLLLAALQPHYRDVSLAMPLLLQIWMFATPVVYPLSLAKAQLPTALYGLYLANPLAGIVDTFRRGVVLHQSPDIAALAVATALTLLLLPVAYIYFKHEELTMADVV